MTMEVEVSGEVYSGASVVAMSVFRHPDIPLGHGKLDLDMEREAVVVELPDNRQLFALLTYNAYLAVKAFSDVMRAGKTANRPTSGHRDCPEGQSP